MTDQLQSLRDIRHVEKTFFLGRSDLFYEPAYDTYEPGDELRHVVEEKIGSLGARWRILRDGVWTHVVPVRGSDSQKSPPPQGWKIHVSATNMNCRDVLAIVTSVLLPDKTQFKFANDTQTLCLMTSKRWPRGGSGKFITVYPVSDEAFRSIIEALYEALKGFKGSYILSDRRYKDSGCVYYRYGGIISSRTTDLFGRKIEVLTTPQGKQVPDRRNPYYELPEWVDEVFPDQAVETVDSDMSLCSGRFQIESALSFSNTGGVYLAKDTHSGDKVVIKEGRPGVELGNDGQDATTRLAGEAEILRAMETSGVTPKPITTFWDWENFYLVEEFLDAKNIRRLMLDDTPLLKVHSRREDRAAFYETFVKVSIGILKSVSEFHDRQIVIGDLSPLNVMVLEDTKDVRIIDLEGAFHTTSKHRQDLHTPGFRRHVKGRMTESAFSDDVYAVGVIMMYCMFPIAAMAYVRADLFETVLPVMIEDMGWEKTPVQSVIRGLVSATMSPNEAIELLERSSVDVAETTGADDRKRTAVSQLRDELGHFVVANWRADASSAIFPVDPFGQRTNPLGLYLGASGVMWVLDRVGIELPAEASRRYRTDLAASDPSQLSPGMLTGTAGMAWAAIDLNEKEQALRLLKSSNDRASAKHHHSLYYGLAGIGMANLAAYRSFRDDQHLADALSIAETLASDASSDDRGTFWRDDGGVRLGLGYGQSGVALFLLRLSQLCGDDRWRRLGAQALEYDLSFGLETEPGVTSFGGEPDHRGTVLPYIEQGSAGIAKVALRYGKLDRVAPMLRDAHRKYSGFPGLIYGLAGLLDVLTDAVRYTGDQTYGGMARLPLHGLHDLYIFDTPQGKAAPGENLFRISCDYATGLSGIIYALHRHDHLGPDHMMLDQLDHGGKS